MRKALHKPAGAAPNRPVTRARSMVLQRKCACGGQGSCDECDKTKLKLHCHAEDHSSLSIVPPIVEDVLRSPGRPLDPSAREFMEPRFGHDFANVRVHDDRTAAESARAVSARAFTLGRDVVFGAGQYAPDTREGRNLLAHELTHVVQQGDTVVPSQRELEVTTPADASELEADAVAERVVGMHAEASRIMTSTPLAVGVRASHGLPRLARATFNVGAQPVQVDYSEIIYTLPADYESAIETRFASWSGSPATVIHTDLTALTQDQKKWVLFGLDILVDNTTAAHAGLNRVQAVQRLIAHAPSALTQPLTGRLPDYPTEVLRVSGWFEVALSARLTAPTGTTLTTVTTLFNPPPGPSAPAGGALDMALLNSDIPPALTTLLKAIDPSRWTSVGTQSLSAIQTIGDQIQAEARTFFSPYADTAMSNAYSRSWQYAANISSTLSIVPTQDMRIGYLSNRAEIVGRQDRPAGSIFSNANYDSSRSADRAALLSIVTTMEADAVIQPIVDRLIQHTGQTSYPAAGPQVGISTEFNLGSTLECAARWRSIDTLTHELVHALVHRGFPASASSVRFGQIIREGFTEVLGVQLFESARSKASGNAAFKGQMEAGIAAAPCPVPAAATIGYGQAGTNAEAIRAAVGNDNFRAAYFLNAVNLVGL